MAIYWPPKLSLASLPTPFQRLDRVSAALGTSVWVKRDDLSGYLLSGNKVRKLEYTLAKALNDKHDVLITCGGLQSNHCRATAFLGAQLGLSVHLVLRDKKESSEESRDETDAFDGNLLLDQLAGAAIDIIPPRQYQQHLPELLEQTAADYRSQDRHPLIIPTGASDGIGVWGYLAAYYELLEDFKREGLSPGAIVCATGSGGTQAGLTLGQAYFSSTEPNNAYTGNTRIIGMAVCDDQAYFKEKVTADIRQFTDQFARCFDNELPTVATFSTIIETNASYIGEGYGIASHAVLETIAWLARTEGILLDPVYSGKAFHGLVADIRAGEYGGIEDIVFVHTGGGFGIFPYRQQFSEVLKSL